MKFEDYFQREMLALRQLAREALARNPALEPFLGTPGRDPDIERVLESFAFLAARLGQKVDDDLPEITHDLFSRLWPNYLRPFPAASVIQYQLTGDLSGNNGIPKGTLVESAEVEGIRCRFQTIYDVDLLPLRVVDQRLIERGGTVIMAVRFALTGVNLQNFQISHLRIFFTGEESIPHTLYVTLTHHLKELRFVIRDVGEDGESREHVTAVLRPSCVKPLGFQEDEGMLPYPENLAVGYRVLQEYFCYPEKFLFVEIADLQCGLSQDTRQRFQHINEFELHFVLEHLPENHQSFRAANWKLFCTPVINIFPFMATPQTIAKNSTKHKIIPDPQQPDLYSVYSVEGVNNWGDSGKGGGTFEHLETINAFEHRRTNAPLRYRVQTIPTLNQEAVETYIIFDHIPHDGLTLDMALLCTNGDLPTRLGLGDIGVAAESAEAATTASCKNILPVSSPVSPPHADSILWQLLSNMSLNTIPLTDVAAFRAMIAPYAFRARHDSGEAQALKKHLQSIQAIKSRSTDRIFRGVPKRG
ncbi:MAG: type VI secretion system baseplate subunit TssF, partial [Desulfobulbaceae bacterium]|nr:type VI secretion system baseplate subunit TssF [Desulfobulbaceae bacterium]